MKLAAKIYGFVMIVVVLLVVIDGYISVERYKEWFEDNTKKDLYLFGRLIKKMVVDICEKEGQEATLQMIKDLNNKNQHILVRWVWLDESTDDFYKPHVSRKEILSKTAGKDFFFSVVGKGSGAFCCYFPVSFKGGAGAIEITESRTEMLAGVNERIRGVFILSGSLVIFGALVLFFFGGQNNSTSSGENYEKNAANRSRRLF